jgi:hypothetical protein
VSLINTDANWQLEFTPQSTSTMESRKVGKDASCRDFDARLTVVFVCV